MTIIRKLIQMMIVLLLVLTVVAFIFSSKGEWPIFFLGICMGVSLFIGSWHLGKLSESVTTKIIRMKYPTYIALLLMLLTLIFSYGLKVHLAQYILIAAFLVYAAFETLKLVQK